MGQAHAFRPEIERIAPNSIARAVPGHSAPMGPGGPASVGAGGDGDRAGLVVGGRHAAIGRHEAANGDPGGGQGPLALLADGGPRQRGPSPPGWPRWPRRASSPRRCARRAGRRPRPTARPGRGRGRRSTAAAAPASGTAPFAPLTRSTRVTAASARSRGPELEADRHPLELPVGHPATDGQIGAIVDVDPQAGVTQLGAEGPDRLDRPRRRRARPARRPGPARCAAADAGRRRRRAP